MIHYILPAVMFVVFAFLTERKDKRIEAEREAHATEVALLNLTLRDRLEGAHKAHVVHVTALVDAHREEVQILCQRIQAPEIAVVEHQQRRPDEGESHPLTDAQLAEEQAKMAFLQRVEQIENENAGLLS